MAKKTDSGNMARAKPPGIQTHAVATVQSVYQGPIPQASELAGYERICSGAADRIIGMAERQAAHRQEMERKIVEGRRRDSRLGIISAVAIALATLAGGVACILHGHDMAGSAIVGLDIVGLCGVFVYGTSLKGKQEKENK